MCPADRIRTSHRRWIRRLAWWVLGASDAHLSRTEIHGLLAHEIRASGPENATRANGAGISFLYRCNTQNGDSFSGAVSASRSRRGRAVAPRSGSGGPRWRHRVHLVRVIGGMGGKNIDRWCYWSPAAIFSTRQVDILLVCCDCCCCFCSRRSGFRRVNNTDFVICWVVFEFIYFDFYFNRSNCHWNKNKNGTNEFRRFVQWEFWVMMFCFNFDSFLSFLTFLVRFLIIQLFWFSFFQINYYITIFLFYTKKLNINIVVPKVGLGQFTKGFLTVFASFEVVDLIF